MIITTRTARTLTAAGFATGFLLAITALTAGLGGPLPAQANASELSQPTPPPPPAEDTAKPRTPATPKAPARPKIRWRRARVSWFGPGLYGSGMAGGGRLKRTSMVVAHRSMRFGTKIEFSYRGRRAVAVVRDRGPFIRGRVFDLGPGTAKKLKFDGVGVVRYRIIK